LPDTKSMSYKLARVITIVYGPLLKRLYLSLHGLNTTAQICYHLLCLLIHEAVIQEARPAGFVDDCYVICYSIISISLRIPGLVSNHGRCWVETLSFETRDHVLRVTYITVLTDKPQAPGMLCCSGTYRSVGLRPKPKRWQLLGSRFTSIAIRYYCRMYLIRSATPSCTSVRPVSHQPSLGVGRQGQS